MDPCAVGCDTCHGALDGAYIYRRIANTLDDLDEQLTLVTNAGAESNLYDRMLCVFGKLHQSMRIAEASLTPPQL